MHKVSMQLQYAKVREERREDWNNKGQGRKRSGEKGKTRRVLLLYEVDEGRDGFRAVGELFDGMEPVVQVRHRGAGVLYREHHTILQLMHTHTPVA